jgi:hypothetical protein
MCRILIVLLDKLQNTKDNNNINNLSKKIAICVTTVLLSLKIPAFDLWFFFILGTK